MKLTSFLLNRPGKKSRDHRAFIFAVVLPLASVLFVTSATHGLSAASASESCARVQQIGALQERQRRLLEFLLQEWQLDDPPAAAESILLSFERRLPTPSLAVVFACPVLPETVRLQRQLLSTTNTPDLFDHAYPLDPPRRGPPRFE